MINMIIALFKKLLTIPTLLKNFQNKLIEHGLIYALGGKLRATVKFSILLALIYFFYVYYNHWGSTEFVQDYLKHVPENTFNLQLPESENTEEKVEEVSKGVSTKTIVIGVTITAVVVCGVGAGILFIPGAPEFIISTVMLCASNGGFGGA